ncbi:MULTISPECIES: 6-phospho-3-hexuloisomerase [unclassified Paenibacillus]|uniref:6-phospho-3-hexuloisomerase n=1 Tax=unclassified Paenibacillus TaxID=185978 RepID=UPI001AE5DB05|nr:MULTISPECIES: 6-phospho-3-hexuloisomerase [unclassified Paenibacillus]MBP1154319.1 6-phospho-3-hexuloisomerase [Paenibacillus sp. PvP091]MBP1170297.1 6-phospho-3-hexuloisomerase [Paenibacillus sp. PvR098]MBP2441325.1 6-phospho-3-hexuloisomerase [Paenibacillus sp. PvP052]
MRTTEYLVEIIKELQRSVDLISDEEAERLADQILQSKKIFAAGAGRSGLMVKSFVMRLMQMGFEAYVVGETVTPNLEKDDLFIIGSGSGETKSLVPMAQKAKSLEGIVAAITIFPDSVIGTLSDITVKLPGSPKDRSDGSYKTIQPMGALFEQTLLLFFDAVILKLMEKKGLDSGTMFGRHANLE